MPHVAFPVVFRHAVASLSVTAVVLGGAVALGAAPAVAAPTSASAGTSTLAASLQASATAGSIFSGRRTVVAPRVRPVLTTGVRTTSLTPPPAAPTPVVVVPVVSETQAYINEVLRLVNVQRTARGLAALKADSCAAGYASAQNAVLVRTGALSHQDLGRVMSGCSARGAGENVAFGNVSAAEMMTMWMNSPGHRENILRSSFTHIGISATKTASGRWYGTQVFLTR